MLGHKSLAAGIRYTKEADRRRLADTAVATLERGVNTEMENPRKVFQNEGSKRG